jgi:hypothetical protein
MRRTTTGEWMGAAFAVALAIVLIIRLGSTSDDKLALALRSTARWSFALFWLASAGGALATLFGSRFQALAHRGRDFGLSFASAHLVHMSLVAYLLYSSVHPFPRPNLIFFGIGVFWVYLLALLSIRPLAAMLNPRTSRILRTVGIEYISLVFLFDFVKNSFTGEVVPRTYLLLVALAIAGPLLRFAAAVKRQSLARRLATS